MTDETRRSIGSVAGDEMWTMTMSASDWSLILSMMGEFNRTNKTAMLMGEDRAPVNRMDIFERFYIQAGLMKDAPDSFVIGSTRHIEFHKKCEVSCGESCTKYEKPKRKRGRKSS